MQVKYKVIAAIAGIALSVLVNTGAYAQSQYQSQKMLSSEVPALQLGGGYSLTDNMATGASALASGTTISYGREQSIIYIGGISHNLLANYQGRLIKISVR